MVTYFYFIYLFIYFFRDTVTHGKVQDLNLTINAELIKNTTNLIRDVFPTIPVYPSIGNNDQWPDDQFHSDNTAIYNLTLVRWREWIDNEQDANYLKGN